MDNNLLICLDSEEVAILIEALWTYASQSRDMCDKNYNVHLAKVTALVDHLNAGGEAP